MGEQTTPFNRHGILVTRIRACPICGQPARAALAKTGRAYLSCRPCMTRIFFNTDRAIDAMLRSDVACGMAPEFAGRVEAVFCRLRDAQDSEEIQKRILKEVGGRCAICESSAMMLRDKKDRPYQRCCFCGSFVFLHSPLGVAGMSVGGQLKRSAAPGRRRR